jgi:hypothetical protein
MRHKHIKPVDEFSLAAIDDIIARGGAEDWAKLHRAVKESPEIREKVNQVALERLVNPYTIRYYFWHRFTLFCRSVQNGS